ncbi:hypothetical protein CMUS01_16395 [Colletotrichum musicola]|uniref:Uncharacterized protein n=1 Tax=Colletotrichum musicola TaxID=2175873 RepID=A0A8H6MIN3_9PEZI|nr:hypothetical protein CMUS01_16395 [Colletotrichum musicola]
MSNSRGFEFLTVQQEQEEQEPPAQLAPQDLQVQGDMLIVAVELDEEKSSKTAEKTWLYIAVVELHSPRTVSSASDGYLPRRTAIIRHCVQERAGVWVRVYGSWTEQHATFGLGIHTTTGSRPAAIGSSEANRAPTRELHGEPRRGGRMDVHELPWSCEWDVGSGLGEIVVERVDEKSLRRAAPPLIGQKFGLVMDVGCHVMVGVKDSTGGHNSELVSPLRLWASPLTSLNSVGCPIMEIGQRHLLVEAPLVKGLSADSPGVQAGEADSRGFRQTSEAGRNKKEVKSRRLPVSPAACLLLVFHLSCPSFWSPVLILFSNAVASVLQAALVARPQKGGGKGVKRHSLDGDATRALSVRQLSLIDSTARRLKWPVYGRGMRWLSRLGASSEHRRSWLVRRLAIRVLKLDLFWALINAAIKVLTPFRVRDHLQLSILTPKRPTN